MKLELVTGGSAATMRLELYDAQNKLVCELSNNEALLGSYPVDDGMRVHVIDKFLMLYEFTDTSNTEKYTLSEEEYNKKSDTVRSFLQRNKLGKYNEEEMKQLKLQQEADEQEERRSVFYYIIILLFLSFYQYLLSSLQSSILMLCAIRQG